MWTIDARCSRCVHKEECQDRTKLIGTLSPLTNELNVNELFVDSPGDGVVIVACSSFVQA